MRMKVAAALGVAGIAIAASFVTRGAGAATPRVRVAAPIAGASTPIQHVIVMVQENHSFDSVLGQWCFQTGRCDGDDVTQPIHLKNGMTLPLKPAPDIVPNSSHNVFSQTVAIDGGKMDGWNKAQLCTASRDYPCLTYAPQSQIPNLLSAASTYAISDHTFTLKNSPSFGGHLAVGAATLDGFTGDIPLVASGTTGNHLGYGCDAGKVADWTASDGTIQSVPSCIPDYSLDPVQYPHGGAFRATPVPHVPTIFDRLDNAGLSWKIYESVYSWSICPSFADCLYNPTDRAKMVKPGNILTDAANGTLPNYAVLLPSSPIGASDQHNNHSMSLGDQWIGKVVSALQKSPEWSSTALFLFYDDGGLFYDHVPPGTNPDGTPQGIRTPMVVASPWVRPGYTDSTPTTIVSVLAFVEHNYSLAPLSANDAGAYAYDNMFDFSSAPSHRTARTVDTYVPPASIRWVQATDPYGDNNGDDT
jgi:phospholipase C